MFKAERKCKKLQIEVGDKILDVYLGDVFKMQKIIEFEKKIIGFSRTLEKKEKGEKVGSSKEALEKTIGNYIIELFNIIFGKENANEIFKFYENNYEEMLLAFMPFINGEYMEAMKKLAEQNSRAKAENIINS